MPREEGGGDGGAGPPVGAVDDGVLDVAPSPLKMASTHRRPRRHRNVRHPRHGSHRLTGRRSPLRLDGRRFRGLFLVALLHRIRLDRFQPRWPFVGVAPRSDAGAIALRRNAGMPPGGPSSPTPRFAGPTRKSGPESPPPLCGGRPVPGAPTVTEGRRTGSARANRRLAGRGQGPHRVRWPTWPSRRPKRPAEAAGEAAEALAAVGCRRYGLAAAAAVALEGGGNRKRSREGGYTGRPRAHLDDWDSAVKGHRGLLPRTVWRIIARSAARRAEKRPTLWSGLPRPAGLGIGGGFGQGGADCLAAPAAGGGTGRTRRGPGRQPGVGSGEEASGGLLAEIPRAESAPRVPIRPGGFFEHDGESSGGAARVDNGAPNGSPRPSLQNREVGSDGLGRPRGGWLSARFPWCGRGDGAFSNVVGSLAAEGPTSRPSLRQAATGNTRKRSHSKSAPRRAASGKTQEETGWAIGLRVRRPPVAGCPARASSASSSYK